MIGGKVLDSSFVAALVRGSFAAAAWLDTARALSLPLYLPSLALSEVCAVRPDAGPQLAELLAHPSIVLRELDAGAAPRSTNYSATPMRSTHSPDTSSTSPAAEAGRP